MGWRGRRDVNFHSANERRAEPMKVSEGLLENQNRKNFAMTLRKLVRFQLTAAPRLDRLPHPASTHANSAANSLIYSELNLGSDGRFSRRFRSVCLFSRQSGADVRVSALPLPGQRSRQVRVPQQNL